MCVWTHLGGLHQVPDVEQSVVDPEDDPVKQSAVQRLGHGVSHRPGLGEEKAKLALSFPSLETPFLIQEQTGRDRNASSPAPHPLERSDLAAFMLSTNQTNNKVFISR